MMEHKRRKHDATSGIYMQSEIVGYSTLEHLDPVLKVQLTWQTLDFDEH